MTLARSFSTLIAMALLSSSAWSCGKHKPLSLRLKNTFGPGEAGGVRIGMTQDEVKAILGAPETPQPGLWEYRDPTMRISWDASAQVDQIQFAAVKHGAPAFKSEWTGMSLEEAIDAKEDFRDDYETYYGRTGGKKKNYGASLNGFWTYVIKYLGQPPVTDTTPLGGALLYPGKGLEFYFYSKQKLPKQEAEYVYKVVVRKPWQDTAQRTPFDTAPGLAARAEKLQEQKRALAKHDAKAAAKRQLLANSTVWVAMGRPNPVDACTKVLRVIGTCDP